jgi:hypothetical protein
MFPWYEAAFVDWVSEYEFNYGENLLAALRGKAHCSNHIVPCETCWRPEHSL